MGSLMLKLASICLLLVKASKCGSFYDNPEQDVIPPPDTPEELHKKWDFEVSRPNFLDLFLK